MNPRFYIFALTFLLFVGFAGNLLAKQSTVCTPIVDSPELSYKKAKEKYLAITNSPKLRNNKKKWDEVIRVFTSVYLKNHENKEIGSKSLWMIARCYYELFLYTRDEQDISDAINRYELLAEKYPDSALADDALHWLGVIYKARGETEKAKTVLARLLAKYPGGDKASEARGLLASLAPVETNRQVASGEALGSAEPQDVQNVQAVAQASDAARQRGAPVVQAIRHWSVVDYTRVVIDVTEPVAFTEGWLPADEKAGKPKRFYVDLKPAKKLSSLSGLDIHDGLLRGVRLGQFDADTVRVVCDLGETKDIKAFFLDDPFRVIIDAFGREYKKEEEVETPLPAQVSATASASVPQPASVNVVKREERPAQEGATSAKKEQQPDKSVAIAAKTQQEESVTFVPKAGKKKFTLAQQLGLGVKRVILDPGHGGKDPGAIGPSGLREKDVTLKVAKQLKNILEADYGCEVFLTRERDVYLTLEERTAIANAKKADIFVSIHTNAEPSNKWQGVETYYLSMAVDDEAMRVAALENSTSQKRLGELKNILDQILKNAKVKESSRLASFMQGSLVGSIKKKNSSVKDRGVKQAPFFVLIGAKMPAVLTEVAFITSPEDEKSLSSDKFLRQIADGIAQGIHGYTRDTENAGFGG